MDELTRRGAIRQTARSSVLATLVSATGANAAAEDPTSVPKEERARVISVGMTDGEADCWELAANLAGKFFALPPLHPMDKQEGATAIHLNQNQLPSRPTSRRYVES